MVNRNEACDVDVESREQVGRKMWLMTTVV